MRSNQTASKFCYLNFDSKPNFRFANITIKKFVSYLLACTCTPLLLGTLAILPRTRSAIASTPSSQQIAQVVSVSKIERPSLKIGSKGNTVNELQAALKLLGFYTGAVNGEYDNATASAVSQFRQAAGLPADNTVDNTVWQKLFPSETTPLAVSPPSPTPLPPTTSTLFPIPTQTQNPNIMSVVNPAPEPRPANPTPQNTQQRSNTSTTIRTTTQNGSQRTTSSTSTRTTSRSTPKTQTQRSTSSTSTRTNNRSNRTATSNRQATSLPKFTQKPNIQYTSEGEPILRIGMRGEEVAYLQGRLRRLGYLKNQPDGDFGVETETAVKALQKHFGLESDGVVGGATWDALLK